MNSVTRTTTRSWGSRIGDSFKGLLFAPIAIIVGIVLIFWNESRTVKTASDLAEGARVVVSVGADSVDPANEGNLIHFIADATTDEVLTDEMFGIETRALRLRRTVEMYQWEEQTKSESATRWEVVRKRSPLTATGRFGAID